MKRFWLVMLSLGLVLAFSASAMAVDVKFSGSFYAAGMYLDKTNLNSNNARMTGANNTFTTLNAAYDRAAGNSTAFYYQRLRVGTDFIVSPGLKLVTRFDAMERIWGGNRSAAFAGGYCGAGATSASGCDDSSAGTRAESENIAFDQAYIEYISPIGLFRVGYQPASAWGTVFGDSALNDRSSAKIVYGVPIGPITIGASMEKTQDNSYSYLSSAPQTDLDYEKYSLAGEYKANNIAAGLAFEFRRIANSKAAVSNAPTYVVPGTEVVANAKYLGYTYALNPYVISKFGPVTVQGEFTYAWGSGKIEGDDVKSGVWSDIAIANYSAYLNVTADFKKFYAGATFAYVSGDDPGTTDKIEGGLVKGGKDFNPTLILFNFDRSYWVGPMTGYYGGTNNAAYASWPTQTEADSQMRNVWFFQGNVGARPLAALDINVALSYANADKKPSGDTGTNHPELGSQVQKNSYGWELDVTGTYKLTNNLSYMLGAGYLWTGDYFKGTAGDNAVNNNYLLINKLTLTF